MVIAWGPEFRFFYNDRYRPVLGASKHPSALGAPAKVIFPEAWPFIGPLSDSTLRGEAVALDDVLIPLNRYGYLENCHFTLSYSPIRDDMGQVGGMLAVVAETTERVEVERRLKTLRDLARRASDAKTAEDACATAASILRVKNNLQVIASLLHLQSDQLKDPEGLTLFEDMQTRIKSMALVHESLYQTGDLARFNFAGYIESLSTHLVRSYRAETSHICLHTALDELALDVDTAIPCGMLLNELRTNALKYAFPDGRAGDIHIVLRAEAGQASLSVRDNGIGLPQSLDFRNTESLGLQLVCLLTEQLGGR
jgi:two-component sensor histidine kinase